MNGSNLPANLPSVAKAKLPAMYSNAKDALAKCERIDECKDWADKAEALASYAKQAQDDELRKTADRIQARAIRRCGQLLGDIEKSVGGRPKLGGVPPQVSRSQAARIAGLSRDQKQTALRVANVGDGDFETAVESPDPPTVTALAERGKLPAPLVDLKGRDPQDFKAATTALGWIRTVSDFCEKHSAPSVAAGLMPHELKNKGETLAQIGRVSKWLDTLAGLLKENRT